MAEELGSSQIRGSLWGDHYVRNLTGSQIPAVPKLPVQVGHGDADTANDDVDDDVYDDVYDDGDDDGDGDGDGGDIVDNVDCGHICGVLVAEVVVFLACRILEYRFDV